MIMQMKRTIILFLSVMPIFSAAIADNNIGSLWKVAHWYYSTTTFPG